MSGNIENSLIFKAYTDEHLVQIKDLCPGWDELVGKIDSVHSFKCVAKEMFVDGRNKNARLHVLEIFATDVCRKHPHISKGVWSHYMSIFYNMTCPHRHFSWLCWLGGKYEKSDIAKHVAECILSYISNTD